MENQSKESDRISNCKNKDNNDIKNLNNDSNIHLQNESINYNMSNNINNIKQQNYIFPKKGLNNIGSTCYMNTTLQCLLHVSELVHYFIDEYPRDLNTLMKINSNVQTNGDISRAFYNLINGVYDKPEYLSDSKKNLNLQTNQKKSSWNLFGSWGINKNNNSFSPEEFKTSLGLHNPQFRKFEANDPKDLILYLLQTMHEELNYFGNKNKRLEYIPNHYNMYETYNHFISNYNM